MVKPKKGQRVVSWADDNFLTDKNDTRPTSSPFQDSVVTLKFKDDAAFSVHSNLLDETAARLPAKDYYGVRSFPDVSSDAGHVFVYSLYTNTYQCLRPKGASPYERLVKEFATCAQVYALSRTYRIQPLETLARAEMERLGQELPLDVVVHELQLNCPTLHRGDVWLPGYLKSRLQAAFRQTSPVPPNHYGLPGVFRSDLEDQGVSISSMLLRTSLELLLEKTNASSIQGQDEPPSVDGALKKSALVMPGPPDTGLASVPETESECACGEHAESKHDAEHVSGAPSVCSSMFALDADRDWVIDVQEDGEKPAAPAVSEEDPAEVPVPQEQEPTKASEDDSGAPRATTNTREPKVEMCRHWWDLEEWKQKSLPGPVLQSIAAEDATRDSDPSREEARAKTKGRAWLFAAKPAEERERPAEDSPSAGLSREARAAAADLDTKSPYSLLQSLRSSNATRCECKMEDLVGGSYKQCRSCRELVEEMSGKLAE